MTPASRSVCPFKLKTGARALLGGLALTLASAAHALNVQGLKPLSAVGETLHAQLTLDEVSDEDLKSLRIRIAAASAYQAAKLKRPAELEPLRIDVRRSGTQTAVVDLYSSASVQTPVLDMLLDIEWATGRLHQQFALLLNAPRPPADTSPQQPASPSTPAVNAAVTVVRGDTLSELMLTHRRGVGTLAQRLIAAQRDNPRAFIRNNVNLVRAGAVLRLPSRDAILAIDQHEAQTLLRAQLADFNAHRRALAQAALSAPQPEAANRGTVDASAAGGTAAPAGDRLALSRGNADAQIAAQQSEQADKSRAAELKQNLDDLNKVAQSLGTDSAQTPQTTGAAKDAGLSGAAPPQGTQPQWLTQLHQQPWLLPAVGALLLLLALWVAMRRRLASSSASQALALKQAADVAQGERAEPDAQMPPIADTVGAIPTRPLNTLLPDIDLDLPPLPPESDDQDSSAQALLEQAKTLLREGDRERARALAELAATSSDAMIQTNAKALLERL